MTTICGAPGQSLLCGQRLALSTQGLCTMAMADLVTLRNHGFRHYRMRLFWLLSARIIALLDTIHFSVIAHAQVSMSMRRPGHSEGGQLTQLNNSNPANY